jgi:hypothetical protein
MVGETSSWYHIFFFIKNFKYRQDVCFMSMYFMYYYYRSCSQSYLHTYCSKSYLTLTPKPHPLRSKVPINLYTTTYLVHSPTQVTKYTFSRPDLWAICERQFGRQKSPSFSSGFHANPAAQMVTIGMSAMLTAEISKVS